jgi:hypothetical protein
VATSISNNFAVPHRLMGSSLTGTLRNYYYEDSLDLGSVDTITTRDYPWWRLLIPSAGASAATPALPQAATPTLLPLLPLLQQWQQQGQHSVAACRGATVAAIV